MNVEAITQHECLFYKTNAASKYSRDEGPGPIEEMFYDDGIREQLCIEESYTTDPQAEVMSFSIISPECIEEIYVERITKDLDRELRFLRKQNLLNRNDDITIRVTEDSTYFGPRKDYRFWQ